ALERKGELAVAGVLHAGELLLEGGRDGVRAGAAVDGDEVALRAVPLRRDVHEVVQLPALRRPLDVPRLQDVLDHVARLLVHFLLERPQDQGAELAAHGLGFLLGHPVSPSGCSLASPFQNGQKGQSSPAGKSSPPSWGQPMFPWLIATCRTPWRRKDSFNACWTFGLVVTSVATHRFMIGSAPSPTLTPAAIFGVVLSSGPYQANVPIGYCR